MPWDTVNKTSCSSCSGNSYRSNCSSRSNGGCSSIIITIIIVISVVVDIIIIIIMLIIFVSISFSRSTSYPSAVKEIIWRRQKHTWTAGKTRTRIGVNPGDWEVAIPRFWAGVVECRSPTALTITTFLYYQYHYSIIIIIIFSIIAIVINGKYKIWHMYMPTKCQTQKQLDEILWTNAQGL